MKTPNYTNKPKISIMINQIVSKITMSRILVVVIGLSALLAVPGTAQVTPVGGIARNFTLTNRANGQPLNLTDFAGKVLVLDFFAYWCGPCQTSSPDIEKNIQEYYTALGGNTYGVPVQVLAVNIESNNSALTDNFVANAGLKLVGNDTNPTGSVWSQFNEANGIPLFVIINCVAGSPSHAQWKVLYKQAGYAGAANLRGHINTVQNSLPISFADYLASTDIPTSQRGPLDDPDHDGISNLMEYALGLAPNLPNASGLPAAAPAFNPATGKNHLVMTISLNADSTGIVLTPQVSSDLSAWNSGSSHIQTVSDTVSNGVRTLVVRDITPISNDSGGRFLRLSVSQL